MAKETPYLRRDDEVPPGAEFVRIRFDGGTLVVDRLDAEVCRQHGLVWDDRIGAARGPAHAYRALVGSLLRSGLVVVDLARNFEELSSAHLREFEPYEHQRHALDDWIVGEKRGVVVLPTGAGKSYVAELAIDEVRRSTLVVAPTLDLVDQWIRRLSKAFSMEVGALGGGRHDVREITVSTYDSAAIHMGRLGGKFGLIVFDEVHHLPGEMYKQAAEQCIAPFRLGLTATPDRDDGRHKVFLDLVGPIVHRQGIKELAGDILSEYDVHTVEVEMSDADRAAYEESRGQYRGFVDSQGIRMSGGGWQRFLAATSRSEEGRAALAAYHRQKKLALAHANKIAAVEELLTRHWNDQVIVFANDNETVYEMSQRFLCPTITHQTPLAERTEVLKRFSNREYRVVMTSKVLNEGVDVPSANVAIILSGTGSVREHVQRLGRILRRAKDKRATLYELVTLGSVESFQSERRRDHDAYR